MSHLGTLPSLAFPARFPVCGPLSPPPSQPPASPAPHYLQLRCLLLSTALSLPSPSSLSIPTPLISGRQPNILLSPESAGALWKAAPRPHAPVNMCVCPCLQLLSPGGPCLCSHRESPLVPKGFLGPSLLKNHWTGQAGGKESLLSFRCQQLVGEGRCPSKGPVPCPRPPAGQELLETEVGRGGGGGRELHAETAQSALTAIVQLVIGGLSSGILVVLSTVNLSAQGPSASIAFATSSRNSGGSCTCIAWSSCGQLLPPGFAASVKRFTAYGSEEYLWPLKKN